MIALYYEARDTRDRVERLLSDARVQSTESRTEFRTLLGTASVGIAGLERCTDADVTWLQTVMGQGLSGPSFVVVAPLSLGRLRRLRVVESGRFNVVWKGETESRLPEVLRKIEPWHRRPLVLLGRRLLSDGSLHPSLARAIERICGLSAVARAGPPTSSVSQLAENVGVPSDTLRRYWREQVPLRCSPKPLMSWSLLFWAVRKRADSKWSAIADEAGVRRRTLERYSSGLAGCTLATAARDPDLLMRRFDEWVQKVSVAENGDRG